MSIEKKSLISNRIATKKANLTKVNATHVATTKLARPAASSRAAVTAAKSLMAPRLAGKVSVSPAMSKLAVNMVKAKISIR